MKFIPHQYQKYAITFIEEHPESMLLLDMGLGKTVITLHAILSLMFDSFEVNKVLVIAPLRVAKNTWPEELTKWDGLDFLKMSVAVGSAKVRETALQTPADIVVVNRENVKWLVEYYQKKKLPWPFDMIVIDELSSFKNHQSQRFRYLKKIRPLVKRMVGLTGTPAPNSLLDLWAQVYLIDMGKRLGRFISRYRNTYFQSVSLGTVFKYLPLPFAEKEIYEKIKDISVSMKAKDYLAMPELIDVNHFVKMSPSEKRLYMQMQKQMIIQLGPKKTIDAANAGVLCGKLLQMAGGAVYDSDGMTVHIHDRKLDMLEDLIEQANGHNVLIAYWFNHEQTRIKDRFPNVREIKTDQDIADWNKGKIPLALIHPASAGHGLNLQQGGHILIWFSQIWSLELYQQCTARLWRQGQDETVTVHHILCQDTIDEDVVKAISEKDATQSRLISAVRARLV